jgi:hypothetical protein
VSSRNLSVAGRRASSFLSEGDCDVNFATIWIIPGDCDMNCAVSWACSCFCC